MTNISEIFAKFNALNVLIVGDVMIDRYLHGRVSRISPEAPVPIVELRSTENRLGGAGNVALNIKALGVRSANRGTLLTAFSFFCPAHRG